MSSKVLITGVTGSLGQAILKYSPYGVYKYIGYSRSEHKQWDLQQRYPQADFFLGDVRDLERLKLATRGVDIIIHAAALKVVPKGELDPIEFVDTNIIGAKNVIQAALANNVGTVIGVSTDKACDPVNLYGATKLCSDKMMIAANAYNKAGKPRFTVVRYGNVLGSNGSVVPLFERQAASGGPITITHPDMTRFIITLEQAVRLIWEAIVSGDRGEILVPDLPAMTVREIADAVAPGVKQKVVGIRPGEKMHEKLEGTHKCFYSNEARKLSKEEFRKCLSN